MIKKLKTNDIVKPDDPSSDSFEIHPIQREETQQDDEPLYAQEADESDLETGYHVKIPLSTFSRLLLSRNSKGILKERGSEEVVLSADLLADIASYEEGIDVAKWVMVFVFGLIFGTGITYLLITFF